jgi:hypothetical protein
MSGFLDLDTSYLVTTEFPCRMQPAPRAANLSVCILDTTVALLYERVTSVGCNSSVGGAYEAL